MAGARTAELSLACAACIVGLVVSVWLAPGWLGLAGGALAILTIVIAVTDRRSFLIPDEMNAAGVFMGLAASGLRAESFSDGLVQSALRAAAMFAGFFVLRAGFRRLRGVDGLGLGDVKLAAVAGAWLDWAYLPLAINVAALAALTAVLVRRVWAGEMDLQSRLPFGTFLAPSIWLCWTLMICGETPG